MGVWGWRADRQTASRACHGKPHDKPGGRNEGGDVRAYMQPRRRAGRRDQVGVPSGRGADRVTRARRPAAYAEGGGLGSPLSTSWAEEDIKPYARTSAASLCLTPGRGLHAAGPIPRRGHTVIRWARGDGVRGGTGRARRRGELPHALLSPGAAGTTRGAPRRGATASGQRKDRGTGRDRCRPPRRMRT